MITMTIPDLNQLARVDRNAAELVLAGPVRIHTTGSELLAIWNEIGSIDLTGGRKAEYDRLSRELAAHDAAVIPAAAVTNLNPARPTSTTMAGFAAVFEIAAAVASLFALGFAAGEITGEYLRNVVDGKSDVSITNDGDGDVNVEVGK
jgi:hypothetical protein